MTADELKAWRQAMGYSQRKAAAEHQVSLFTYQQWERGTRFDTGQPAPILPRTVKMCALLMEQKTANDRILARQERNPD